MQQPTRLIMTLANVTHDPNNDEHNVHASEKLMGAYQRYNEHPHAVPNAKFDN